MTDIDLNEFRSRLTALCIGGGRGFPKKVRDRHVILAASLSSFQRGMIYTEKEVNEALSNWLETGCPALAIDEVTMRRELIDAAYLMRDDAGRFYAVGPGPAFLAFTDEVASADPVSIIKTELAERTARKRANRSESPTRRSE